jgi:translation initiation factor 1
VCPHCGWPQRDCKCSTRHPDAAAPVRAGTVVAKLRVEKKGRAGKAVTVVDGLPNNATFLKELAQELKRACACGGGTGHGYLELQGDLRDRVRDLLRQKGFVVKG